MPLKQEELPSPIQTSDAELGSGPETVESLISGPRSIKTEASIKTEGSIKTEASTKTESSKARTANGSSKPSSSRSASLHGFLLSDSPKQTANGNGSGSGGGGAAATDSVPAPLPVGQIRGESNDDVGNGADVAASEPSLPAEDDRESALSRALCAPRRKAAPPDTRVPQESPGDDAPAVSAGDREGPGNGLAYDSVERVAEETGEDWGGGSEGMFRKRISLELKAMLAKSGGVCTMMSLAKTYKRHHHRTLNLLGKKLRVLLTTGSGLYGIGLYGTGQDAEIRLEQSHAVMGDAPAVDPDSGSRQSGAQKLTMTFVNSNALQNGESPRGRSPLYESGNERHHHSYDRPAYDTRHGDGATSRAAALHSTPKPLGSRKTLGYANSSTEATARMQNFSSTDDRPRGSTYATQRLPEANMQWDGGSRVEQGRSRSSGRRRSRSFGRRRSRSVGRRRSRSFDRRRSRSFGRRPSRSFDHRRSRSLSRNRRHATASRGAAGDGWAGRAESGGGRDAPPRQGYRRSRSPSGHKRISHPARRDSPRRRSSPQRRRGRSPSPRSSRGLPRSSLNRKRSRSGSRRRNSSPPKIHGSLRRRGSPPRHSPRRSTELSRAHRSRGDSKDRASATRGRNSSNRRDGRSSSPAAKARKPARERSVEAAEDGETTMRRGNGDHHEGHRVQQQGFDRVPPRDYKATPPAAVYAKPVGYGAKPMQSAPKEATRAPDNGRGAVVGATAGARTVDPIIPLALGGAPVPPVAAVPGKRFLIEGVVGGGGGFPASDDPATKLYHTASGNGDKAYPAGNGRMPRVGWPHRDVAGNQGGGGGGPLAPHLAPAVLPPMSSLRPMPLPAGCAQGARLMIKGTHPAVPERRIHALVSAFGIVGKIEVLEGFVFVHMKSIEEASRAVIGLNGKTVPHVCPQVNTHSGPPPGRLVAAIWREEHYLALMSKENMRAYADNMRKASTWYERQTKSGFIDPSGERMPCRFFALGRGCIFGNNCGFSHQQEPPPYPRAPVNTHGNSAGPGFGQPLSKPQRLLPSPAFEPGSDPRVGAPPLGYRQERIPVIAHHGQSPALTFVHRDEVEARPGLGAQQGHKPAYPGNAVGVAMPWQPEHGAGTGGAIKTDRVSPHPGISNGKSVDAVQPNVGRDSSKALENSEPQRNGLRQASAAARANPHESAGKTRRSEHRERSRSRDGSGSVGRGRDRGNSRDGNRGGSEGRLPHGVQRGRNESRERGDRRGRASSPVLPRSRSPRRSSGGFEKSGQSKGSVRDATRQRGRSNSRRRRSQSHESAADRPSRKERRDSRSRRSKSHGSASHRGSRKHRRDSGGRRSKSRSPAGRVSGKHLRDNGGRRSKSYESATCGGSRKYRRDSGGRQQYRASRSSSRGRRRRDYSSDRHGRSATRRDRNHLGDRSRGSVSPMGKQGRYRDNLDRSIVEARRYDSDNEYDMDGRRQKKIRQMRGSDGGRSRDGGRREEERDPFLGRGSGSDGRREDMSVNHGWVSLANNPGGFSREEGRQSFAVSPRRDSGSGPFQDGRYQDEHPSGFIGSGQQWNDEFMQPEVPARPVKTQFTVTARMGSLQPPPSPAPVLQSHSATKFSIIVPPNISGALGPSSPPEGVRRGGRPPRGRGRGGRFGNERTGGRRPPRGHQYDNTEYNDYSE